MRSDVGRGCDMTCVHSGVEISGVNSLNHQQASQATRYVGIQLSLLLRLATALLCNRIAHELIEPLIELRSASTCQCYGANAMRCNANPRYLKDGICSNHQPLTRTTTGSVHLGDPSARDRVVVPCVAPVPKYNITQSVTAYKKAATKAPKPRKDPAATLTLAAAPAEFWGAPVPEAPDGRTDPVPVTAPDPDAPEPLAADEVWSWTVVELLALTTIVRVWLNMEPVPGRTSV